jgi:hypothetical protein
MIGGEGKHGYHLTEYQFFLIWKAQFRPELKASYLEYFNQSSGHPEDCMSYDDYCLGIYQTVPYIVQNTYS